MLAITELEQDGIGMLAQLRTQPAGFTRRGRQLGRDGLSILTGVPSANWCCSNMPREKLRVAHHVAHRIDLA
ncbi:hypothetical protein LP419_06075 [Massilia sp. H-1]|nr:hypothetical protein LP419_06075 [Massilia sp. H-1]